MLLQSDLPGLKVDDTEAKKETKKLLIYLFFSLLSNRFVFMFPFFQAKKEASDWDRRRARVTAALVPGLKKSLAVCCDVGRYRVIGGIAGLLKTPDVYTYTGRTWANQK